MHSGMRMRWPQFACMGMRAVHTALCVRANSMPKTLQCSSAQALVWTAARDR